ncbi:hypothetical protein HYU96_00695 [Candidatus Daviesbacteria bacterium]|nr:hypothetical protein [Candidatus Daviesbacteria bacterium]
MSSQMLIIGSLAMDLKRVALGLHRGSYAMANRFKQEALQRVKELENEKLNSYLKNLMEKTKKALGSREDRTAEDALMYSTLFQNYATKNPALRRDP